MIQLIFRTFDHLAFMGNETVIQTLTQVKGIGRWTAEMFLIFSLGRLDVLSLLDVGLQRGVKWLFSVEKEVDGKKLLEDKGKQWAPTNPLHHYIYGKLLTGDLFFPIHHLMSM